MEKVLKTINNQKITIINNEGEKLVPIKPICLALGIDYPTQYDKLKNDEFLSSVVGLSPTTAADGKEYEMVCLPLQYVFGWLFTINPKNVAPDAKEIVMKYRIECYDALYNYFTARTRTIEKYNRDVLKLSN